MPQLPPFEKEKLHQNLMDVGKKLFIAQGLKKTSLEQLTQAIGIAKSTFYTFYDSKESMYLELLEIEAVGMEERVWGRVKETVSVYDGILAYLHQMVHELRTNLLSQRLMTHPEELEMVKLRVTPEFVERKMKRNVIPLMTYITKQQKMGRMINDDPVVIVGVMRAAMLMEIHRKDFGEEVYSKVEDIMFSAVANALTTSPNKHEE
ncbi:TetR/AcrR family transcriptional regulator [Neobacillus massiliamazoniensis]|uniref:Bacterial regulatory proteins, tetR family n=1 Tax=Neobacillus massiliamazoniensis TaxID=1499688 RepID=A0A0U1NY24_9BACI|nr:TetR/AcrR family transcriptional regulator [Neobacillus massiliamazoniensis]CRK82907.1 Bacterial regulatory proteins, tetR family [Neobacillus massiliamazoniensis]